MKTITQSRQDVYTRITTAIVAELEKGTRPWTRPWSAEHAAGRITRPLRHNGQPYSGINILSLWASASVQGFAAPIWMTYRQAAELGAHVRRGEKGSPVVYAQALVHTAQDAATGVRHTRSCFNRPRSPRTCAAPPGRRGSSSWRAPEGRTTPCARCARCVRAACRAGYGVGPQQGTIHAW